MEVRPPTPTMVVSELLTKNNYKTWRVQMKCYLSSKGLWDIVSGEEQPAPGSSGEWTRKNDAALHAIQISCGTKAFREIDTTSSAKDAWEMLMKSGERWGERLSKNGYTALHAAISTGQQGIVDSLIEEISPEQLEIRDKKKRTALALAAYHGKTETARRLIGKNRRLLRMKDSEGNIPLLAACQGGHVEMTHFLWDELMKDYGQANSEEKNGLMNDAAFFLQASIKSKMFGKSCQI
ncbi:hypothetical protein SLEP1_g9604 [Rubroshorea leprosula]|uniref:DUF4219 domain-containing protein n=1 Tax=Rubroshorea leprosula TaxID=152421 RepID=A0AAV5I5F1_9ROSI|nr:hypothetical protein SLEP1_g9604 [Rubroshorea leprosula]